MPEVIAERPVVDDSIISESDGSWCYAYCRSRCEQAFVADMKLLDYAAYCQLNLRYAKRNGKFVPIWEPAFRGYAFVAIPGEPSGLEFAKAWEKVRNSARLACRCLIQIKNQRRFIKQINSVKRALEIDPRLQVSKLYVPGRRVRVIRGEWKGYEAVIDTLRKNKLVVYVDEILGGVDIPVSLNDVEFLD